MLTRNKLPRTLICDDDQNLHLALRTALSKDYDLKSAYNSDEALIILKKNQFDIILLDMDLRHPQEGIESIPKILELQPDLIIIVFSGRTEFSYVRNAMKLGAYDFVPKDAGVDELQHVLKKALEHKIVKDQNLQTQFEIKNQHQSHALIGNSPAIEKIKKQIERARLSPAPIIINGDSGTGKEIVARMLRRTLPDGSLEPFVSVDSGTIQSSVAESLLFGYEKGAFTGAEKVTRGLFEEANGGSIYFDEIANMPLEIQNKLLRVIQEKEVLRMGSAKPIALDFRVICATNQDLEALVKQGKFKDDLYQRFNVLQIHLPPLSARKEDLALLVEHFSKLHQNRPEKLEFLPETLQILHAYSFPGNIRELSNLVLYLYTMCESTSVSPLDLPPKFMHESENNERLVSGEKLKYRSHKNFYRCVEAFEQELLKQEYTGYEGNVSKMSTELEMDRSYLHGKLKSYGIHHGKK